MGRLLGDCFCCSLRTACVFIAAYTMVVAMLLLIFNVNDVVIAGNTYIMWGRVTSLVFAGLLIIASLCLFRGISRDHGHLLSVWLVIFFIYTIISLTTVSFNIHYYRNSWVPADIRQSVLADMIIFGILFFFDIWCLMAVYSQREHIGGHHILP